MGSVIDYIECPHCKSENMYSEFYYKRNERMQFCDQCGYSYQSKFKRDEEDKLITIDGTRNYDFSNLTIEENVIVEPHGVIRIVFLESGNAHCGTIETKESYEAFIEWLDNSNDKEGLYESISFSHYNKEKQQIEKEQLYHKK